MNMGMMPAWQAREMQRQKLLGRIQQKITAEAEKDMVEWDLYRILIRFFDAGLLGEDNVDRTARDLSTIPQDAHDAALCLYREVLSEIRNFSRSAGERLALLAQLLEWTAERRTEVHHRALRNEEFAQPKLIYGVGRATDEVPIPDD